MIRAAKQLHPEAAYRPDASWAIRRFAIGADDKWRRNNHAWICELGSDQS